MPSVTLLPEFEKCGTCIQNLRKKPEPRNSVCAELENGLYVEMANELSTIHRHFELVSWKTQHLIEFDHTHLKGVSKSDL